MSLAIILGLIIVAAVIGVIPPGKARKLILLSVCIFIIYILQPTLPIRNLGFWLSTTTLALTIMGWILVTPKDKSLWRKNWPAVVIICSIVIAAGFTRYLNISFSIISISPPPIISIVVFLAVIFLLSYLFSILFSSKKIALIIAIILLLLILIFLKTPSLTTMISRGFRVLSGQSTSLVSILDIRWLGFSYIAFRLIHTLRDSFTRKLPLVNLDEYIIFMLFYPAVVAGPIDRLERFVEDLHKVKRLSTERTLNAGKRLILGIFKKFVLADSLAIIALSMNNALQVKSTGWTWFLVYAYSFQILFDFSGYTDIAIGLGELLGIKLPENFNRPYLKSNLTQFWNSWHMTLTNWFRSYFFNPLTRFLRSRKKALSIPLIILVTQVTTMMLIGFWHGITWNFLMWGLWHAIGLFIQNRWSNFIGKRVINFSPPVIKGLNLVGGLLTFNFVAIGWVFFALETPQSSFVVLANLFGLI